MTENTTTAAALRAEAAADEQEAFDSFERCDTDGFVSQWAHGLTAQEKRLEATILENGGRAEFAALFNLDGDLVPAKMIDTRYGTKWGIFESAEAATGYHGRIVEWVGLGDRALAKHGYRRGTVLAAAKAKIMGSGHGLAGAASCYVGTVRTDGGFDPDAEVVDNGR